MSSAVSKLWLLFWFYFTEQCRIFPWLMCPHKPDCELRVMARNAIVGHGLFQLLFSHLAVQEQSHCQTHQGNGGVQGHRRQAGWVPVAVVVLGSVNQPCSLASDQKGGLKMVGVIYLFIYNAFITYSKRNGIKNTYNTWWGGIQQS